MMIHCKYDELVPVKSLRPYKKNRNKHPKDQIERLSKILEYQGIRAPIVVDAADKTTIVKGHGTLEAIKKNNWHEAPVVYQSFDSEEQRYLYVQSDNAIASWSELDLSSIHVDISELGPFDLDLLGVENFQLEPDPTIDPELDFSREIMPNNNYIVLLFDNKEDFDVACDKVGLKRVNVNVSASGNESFVTQGLGRIIEGKSVIEKL
jgi:hypothetical protein